MQNDTIVKPEERRNYKNVGDAFFRIVKEEGVLSLWKGCTPTVVRAISGNLGTKFHLFYIFSFLKLFYIFF